MLFVGMAPQNEIMLVVLVVLAVACAVVGLLLMWRFPFPSHRQALDVWAQRHGLQIHEARRRRLFCGPFTFFRSTAQAVFRIIATDESGRIRKGFVRVGGFFGFGDCVKIAWDRGPEDTDDEPDVDGFQ